MQPMLEAWREAAQACRPQKHRDTFESPDPFEPGQYPREADIEPTLEAKQKIVGGLIDVAYPFPDDNVCVVLNDEAS